METFLIATGVVALAEVGDKTQLLSLILAAKYRKPLPICIGIFLATIVNHALAGFVGELIASWITPGIMHWIVVARSAPWPCGRWSRTRWTMTTPRQKAITASF